MYDDADIDRLVHQHYPELLPAYKEMKPIQRAGPAYTLQPNFDTPSFPRGTI